MDESTFPDDEEQEEQQQEPEENENVSIPLGGPIYVPNHIGPLTSVSAFLTLALNRLQELEAELCTAEDDSAEDISVDQLKILTESDLVSKAFELAFSQSGIVAGGEANCSQGHNEPLKQFDSLALGPPLLPFPVSKGMHTGSATTLENDVSAHSERENDSSRGLVLSRCSVKTADCRGISGKGNIRKHKRKAGPKKDAIQDSLISRVEQLAKIKQKQDEDKVATRLHSFNGSNLKKYECIAAPGEKMDRMTTLRSMSSSTKVTSPNVFEHVPVTYPEVVLCVEVYHNIRTSTKTQELLVLGQQSLTELRDHIYCLTDKVMHKAGQHDPSGYFLIEDIFCNDMRNPSAIDYSEPILRWLRYSRDEALKKWEYITTGGLKKKHKAVLGDFSTSQLPNFRATDMRSLQFCDLSFRLGATYLYCHQGDCRHTIVIRDMRLIHLEDVQNRAAYPILVYQLKWKKQKCAVCNLHRATKVTVNDKWARDYPCYFCQECYLLLHYSSDGLPLYGGFQTYAYEHD